jgi:bacillithiol biosynthesis cysteine-adding enzyme BshC
MRIDPIQLNSQSKLINDYRNNKNNIMDYFDYSPFHNYEQRVNDLKDRTFNREQLTEVLYEMNRKWDAPESTYHNIERLKNGNSVVVIGGQQAGLLTGPIYSINKIISIIQFARQQERELNVPVIPVFWIAGEDHDFDEINHIFMPENGKMKKHVLSQNAGDKQSVSHIAINQSKAVKWVDKAFEQLDETAYTKDLYSTVTECLEQSDNYAAFFARLIFRLFDQEGLVLIDSGDNAVRRIESDYFISLIEQQPEIAGGVHMAHKQAAGAGYTISLDTSSTDAHLFYHYRGERILLMRGENGTWKGKQNEIVLTTEELMDTAKNTPELLSNNVVTRPLMQELLFPVLAFIGGNGEISYWSVLKPAFRSLGMKMPPVLPRLSFTYISRNVDKLIKKYAVSDACAVTEGVAGVKQKWLDKKNEPPVEQLADEMKKTITRAHEPLRETAREMRADFGDVAEKNLEYLHGNIDYLKGRLIRALEEKYAKELAEFEEIQNALHPNGGLQERMWNPLPLLNIYGADFIKTLTDESCCFEKEHFLVYI